MSQAQEVIIDQPRDIAPVNETTAIIQVIERAAANPNVDIDKMERLLEMQERIMARNAKNAFASAFATMQPELPVIKERGGITDRSGNVQSRYALWEDMNEAIRPALAKHGFSLSFRTGYEGDKIVVTGVLLHREGHSEETTMHLPLDMSGSKNAVQGVGSSTSYGKRYTAQALLNLTSGGEDDDGKAAGNVETIDADQVGTLRRMLASIGSSEERFLKFIKVTALEEIAADRFLDACKILSDKGAKA